MHVRVRARVRVLRAAASTGPPGARVPYYRLWVRVIRSGRAADAGGRCGWSGAWAGREEGREGAERVRRGCAHAYSRREAVHPLLLLVNFSCALLCAHEYSRREATERGAERGAERVQRGVQRGCTGAA